MPIEEDVRNRLVPVGDDARAPPPKRRTRSKDSHERGTISQVRRLFRSSSHKSKARSRKLLFLFIVCSQTSSYSSSSSSQSFQESLESSPRTSAGSPSSEHSSPILSALSPTNSMTTGFNRIIHATPSVLSTPETVCEDEVLRTRNFFRKKLGRKEMSFCLIDFHFEKERDAQSGQHEVI